jgi:hypothetical protein
VDEYGDSELKDKWQTVLGSFPPENITAAKIAEALDENPEGRAKQVRIGGQAYLILQKKAAAAGMAISKYLERLIGEGEPPDDEPPDDEPPDRDKYETELTPEKEAICDRAEAFVKKAKSPRGFAIKKLSRCHQEAINLANRSRSDQVSDSS